VFKEILVNKIILFLFIFFSFSNCSLDTKSGFWTKDQKIAVEKNIKIKELFKDEEALKKELNVSIKINLKSKLENNSFVNNLDNNNGQINYNGELKSTSRFKFSKIKNFYKFEPDIFFDKNSIVFFDNKGSILKFNESSKLIWKKNFYTKREKKKQPILFFAGNKETLIVADNISKYYAVNIMTGELIWSKSNTITFNSQIKIYKNNFFVVDLQNTLRCFSIKDGNEIWKVNTEKTFIKSQKKLSLIIVDNKVIFSNSIGDISAVDIITGRLLWQTPTESSAIYEDSFSLKTSDIVAKGNSIIVSNNKNKFYSLDVNSGAIIWEQKINSSLRSTLINNLVFTVTEEGFLVVVDNDNGNIIRITNVFDKFKKRKKNKIKPEGFIIGTKNIYLTTNNGRLIVIDILNGKSKLVLKIDKEKISRPFALNKNLFIIKDNAIIKLN